MAMRLGIAEIVDWVKVVWAKRAFPPRMCINGVASPPDRPCLSSTGCPRRDRGCIELYVCQFAQCHSFRRARCQIPMAQPENQGETFHKHRGAPTTLGFPPPGVLAVKKRAWPEPPVLNPAPLRVGVKSPTMFYQDRTSLTGRPAAAFFVQPA